MAVALTRLADLAHEHLLKAGAAIVAVPGELRSVFAPVSLLRAELNSLDFESPFQPPRDLADWRKIARLWWWRVRAG
jgi:hypothetical protein